MKTNVRNPATTRRDAALTDLDAQLDQELSDLEVDLSIQERDISKVFQGQRCFIKAEAFPERRYEGVVSRLMPIADRSKGTISVRVRVEVPRAEEGLYLRPEGAAFVSFLGAEKQPAPPANSKKK